MTLVDTSVWVDHFRQSIPQLNSLIETGRVRMHPLVLGEVAMGSLKDRAIKLRALHELYAIDSALHEEVLRFVERHALFSTGISFVDAHLLAAVRIAPGCTLWTRDKRLHNAASDLGIASPLV